MQIGVIGASGDISNYVKTQAEEIGKLIAQKRAVLICGGLGSVMEYAAKGAKTNNGLTVGLLPTEEKTLANPYIDVIIPTDMGYGRNNLVVLASDVVIAINGSTGTLSEIAMAMNYKIPVIVLKGSGGVADIFNEIYVSEWQLPWPKERIQIVNTPEEAVDLAIKSIKRKIE